MPLTEKITKPLDAGALKNVKRLVAAQGELSGYFHISGFGSGSDRDFAICTSLLSKDPKGAKTLAKGKKVARDAQAKPTSTARGLLTFEDGKLVLSFNVSQTKGLKGVALRKAVVASLQARKSPLAQILNKAKLVSGTDSDDGEVAEAVVVQASEQAELDSLVQIQEQLVTETTLADRFMADMDDQTVMTRRLLELTEALKDVPRGSGETFDLGMTREQKRMNRELASLTLAGTLEIIFDDPADTIDDTTTILLDQTDSAGLSAPPSVGLDTLMAAHAQQVVSLEDDRAPSEIVKAMFSSRADWSQPTTFTQNHALDLISHHGDSTEAVLFQMHCREGFSEENPIFLERCRDLPTPLALASLQQLHDEFLCVGSPREVNIDHTVRSAFVQIMADQSLSEEEKLKKATVCLTKCVTAVAKLLKDPSSRYGKDREKVVEAFYEQVIPTWEFYIAEGVYDKKGRYGDGHGPRTRLLQGTQLCAFTAGQALTYANRLIVMQNLVAMGAIPDSGDLLGLETSPLSSL